MNKTKNKLLAFLALALILGLAWVAREAFTGKSPRAVEPAPMAAPAPEVPADEPELGAAPALDAPALAAPAPVREVVAEAPVAADPYTAALSGVIGRLVDADGKPVPGLEVVLLELSLQEAQAAMTLPGRGFEMPDPAVARAVSDAEGRFRLGGARSGLMHALSGSPSSPRVPLRLIGEALAPGKLVDLGDVVLRDGATLAGRLIDAHGAPVAGARLRAGELMPDLPELAQIFAFGAVDLRPDGGVFVGDEEEHFVLLVPPVAAQLQAYLGLAEGVSATDGTFVLEGVAAGRSIFAADKSGYVGAYRTDLVTTPGQRFELGDIALGDGVTVRGRVLDAGDKPVAGAEVLVGTQVLGEFALLMRARNTDAEGRYELSGLNPGPSTVVVARPDSGSPWAIVLTRQGLGDVDVDLGPSGTLALKIVDQAGAAVASPKVELTPDPLREFGPFSGLVPPTDFSQRVREVEPGSFVIEGLPHGKYLVAASAPGRARAEQPLELEGERAELTLQLVPALELAVTVVDSANRGVARALVLALPPRGGDGELLGCARTDATGKARLPLTAERLEEANYLLRVDHPGFASAYRALSPEEREARVQLSAGGAIHVRLVPAPDPLDFPLLTLEPRDLAPECRDETAVRLLRLGLGGEGELTHLPPGEWSYVLVQGWARDTHLLDLFAHEPDDIARGRFTVIEGQTTEVEIHRGAAADVACQITGTLTIDGQPAQGATVSLNSRGKHVQNEVGPDGAFEFRDVEAGDLWLAVRHSPNNEHSGSIDSSTHVSVEPGERRHVDLAWETMPFVVTVSTEDGLPASHASVSLNGMNGEDSWFSSWSEADAEGRARFRLIAAGEFNVSAQHSDYGAKTGSVHVERGGSQEFALTLDRGLPCAGRITAVGAPAGEQHAALFFHCDDLDISTSASIELKDGAGTFVARGLREGKYQVMFYGLPVEYDSLSIELGPSGDEGLELVFRPQ